MHKRLVMFLWNELGKPGIWTLLMLVIFTLEVINGFTLIGGFWVVVCLLASFLSRIANAVEAMAESRPVISERQN